MVTHSCTDFGMEQNKVYGDALLPAMAGLKDVWFLSLPRISPSSAVASQANAGRS